MHSLGTFLDKKYSKSEPKKSVDEKAILFLMGKFLEEEYGKRGAAQLVPKYFHDGKLGISAKSSLWASEVRSDASRIQSSLNQTLGTDAVLEIRVRHEFGS